MWSYMPLTICRSRHAGWWGQWPDLLDLAHSFLKNHISMGSVDPQKRMNKFLWEYLCIIFHILCFDWCSDDICIALGVESGADMLADFATLQSFDDSAIKTKIDTLDSNFISPVIAKMNTWLSTLRWAVEAIKKLTPPSARPSNPKQC